MSACVVRCWEEASQSRQPRGRQPSIPTPCRSDSATMSHLDNDSPGLARKRGAGGSDPSLGPSNSERRLLPECESISVTTKANRAPLAETLGPPTRGIPTSASGVRDVAIVPPLGRVRPRALGCCMQSHGPCLERWLNDASLALAPAPPAPGVRVSVAQAISDCCPSSRCRASHGRERGVQQHGAPARAAG